MVDTKSTDEEILKQLIEEMHVLNEKIDALSLKYSQEKNLNQRKNIIKEKCEKQSNFCYVLGGLAIALASLMLGFSQTLSVYFYYVGYEKMNYFLFGNGLIIFAGLLMIFSGYNIAKYSNRIGSVKKIKILGRKGEVAYFWKRDIPIMVATVFVFAGIFFLFLSIFPIGSFI